ncbi:MAG: Asp-tRNA(Asn)/Glu-tRNA(Gln) amidotransferase subunit GatC [Endomicrobium sp.]|jgi:aspartyl-tRNA(Asn)/glutamyl-tRNA(Gln) amidotransferase subunit C|nr:Asp-tRNA(Asn)/Glu-tRNA(Gln) amidotransferase subunit GatC [Endomicrobium sp.]
MLMKELDTIAFFSRIKISEREKKKYLEDLSEMFDYIEILQEPDVASLEPTTHVTKLRNVWREDIVKSCPKEIVDMMLNSSPEREKTFYKVKKIISD